MFKISFVNVHSKLSNPMSYIVSVRSWVYAQQTEHERNLTEMHFHSHSTNISWGWHQVASKTSMTGKEVNGSNRNSWLYASL